MAIDYEDRKSLKDEIIAAADERYVRVDDCNATQKAVNNRFANDDKRIDLLVAKINTWEKLLWAIASASIGALVVEFLSLILK